MADSDRGGRHGSGYDTVLSDTALLLPCLSLRGCTRLAQWSRRSALCRTVLDKDVGKQVGKRFRSNNCYACHSRNTARLAQKWPGMTDPVSLLSLSAVSCVSTKPFESQCQSVSMLN